MGNAIELPIAGQVVVDVLANLRQGSASTSAPIVRKLAPDTTLDFVGLVVGEAFQGNAHWYHCDGDTYLWAGACANPTSYLTAAADASGQGPNLNQTPMVVDLYHGDGVESFATAKAAGVIGIIHKATTGASGRDDAYKRRKQSAHEVGLLWGAYHWGTAAPVDQQVSNFLDWAEVDQTTLVALDFEQLPGDQMSLDQARAFCHAIEAKLNRKAVIYSGDTAKRALGDTVDPYLAQHRLWLCQYGPRPIWQRSWSGYWLWQYTDGGPKDPGQKTVPGIVGNREGRIDCNYFPGDAAALKSQWAS